jgi:hypothetical protein
MLAEPTGARRNRARNRVECQQTGIIHCASRQTTAERRTLVAMRRLRHECQRHVETDPLSARGGQFSAAVDNERLHRWRPSAPATWWEVSTRYKSNRLVSFNLYNGLTTSAKPSGSTGKHQADNPSPRSRYDDGQKVGTTGSRQQSRRPRRGRSSEAEHQLPKLRTRVRFSSPALDKSAGHL